MPSYSNPSQFCDFSTILNPAYIFNEPDIRSRKQNERNVSSVRYLWQCRSMQLLFQLEKQENYCDAHFKAA